MLSEDPIGFAGGDANVYLYGSDSPTNVIDPSGLCGVIPGIDLVQAAIGRCSASQSIFIFASYLLPELRVARGIRDIEEGIYVIRTERGIYVGQSGSIAARLTSHVASGRFSQEEINAAERYSVRGGKTRGRSASS